MKTKEERFKLIREMAREKEQLHFEMKMAKMRLTELSSEIDALLFNRCAKCNTVLEETDLDCIWCIKEEVRV